MSKSFRMLIAGIFLIGILFLAQGQKVWAGNLPAGNHSGVAQNQPNSALPASDAKPGTVKPPPVVVPPISAPGMYSVGGICTLQVTSLADTVSLHANILPLAAVHDKPAEVDQYLAGVCSLNYVKQGTGLTDLAPEDGSVKICFAAVPNTTGKIYVFDGSTWTALDTTEQNGLMCANAGKTGKYVLTSMP